MANRKFNFVLYKPEQKNQEESENQPYIRLQKPGSIVFPKKTLEYLGIPIVDGTPVMFRLFIDKSKRAIAFKINEKITNGDLKDVRTITLKGYMVNGFKNYTLSISAGKIFNTIGDVPVPVRCDLDEYEDTDEYLGIGKVYYFVIPKNEAKEPVQN